MIATCRKNQPPLRSSGKGRPKKIKHERKRKPKRTRLWSFPDCDLLSPPDSTYSTTNHPPILSCHGSSRAGSLRVTRYVRSLPRGWTVDTYLPVPTYRAVSLSSLNGSFLTKLQSKSDPACHPVTLDILFLRLVLCLSVHVIDTYIRSRSSSLSLSCRVLLRIAVPASLFWITNRMKIIAASR